MATRNTIMLATWHFHIEISSKCTLACPRCARQEVPDGLVNTELDLSFFKKNFTPEFILSNLEKITFCGDDGDPIYAHDLIPVIQYIKSVKPVEIVIVTNGSHKKYTWWRELAQSLDSKDSIHFSIDGYDNASNNLYRVNSNYTSIMLGIQTVRRYSKCKITWAAIAFKFNEDYIDNMRDQARELGVDVFQLTKSTKFGSVYPSYGTNDPLQPSIKFISSTHRFEREVDVLTNEGNRTDVSLTNIKLYKTIKSRNDITPLCEIGNKGLYIDARGRLFPCCWVANRYNHNSDWQQQAENFNLNNRSLIDTLADPFWITELQTFRWQECKTKCKSSVVDENYATSW
jgi:MoaA/NifB/PqqE/SkfB family radical SAM enzyme